MNIEDKGRTFFFFYVYWSFIFNICECFWTLTVWFILFLYLIMASRPLFCVYPCDVFFGPTVLFLKPEWCKNPATLRAHALVLYCNYECFGKDLDWKYINECFQMNLEIQKHNPVLMSASSPLPNLYGSFLPMS